MLAASDGSREGEIVTEESWFLKGLAGSDGRRRAGYPTRSTTPSARARTFPIPFVKFAFPVRNYDNKLAGVLVASVHWHEIEDIRSAMQRGGDEIRHRHAFR